MHHKQEIPKRKRLPRHEAAITNSPHDTQKQWHWMVRLYKREDGINGKDALLASHAALTKTCSNNE